MHYTLKSEMLVVRTLQILPTEHLAATKLRSATPFIQWIFFDALLTIPEIINLYPIGECVFLWYLTQC